MRSAVSTGSHGRARPHAQERADQVAASDYKVAKLVNITPITTVWLMILRTIVDGV